MTEQKSGRVKSMFRLLKYLRPYYRNMIFGIICGIGQHLSNIASSGDALRSAKRTVDCT